MKFVHVEVVADSHILGIAQKGEAFAPCHFELDELGESLGEVYPTLEEARSAGVTAITDRIDFVAGWESYNDGDTTAPCWVSAAYLNGWNDAKASYEQAKCAEKEKQEEKTRKTKALKELSDPARRMATDAAAKLASLQMFEKNSRKRKRLDSEAGSPTP